jgi:hypothetical protein|tara:strand:+ start:986 stop:1174 length:189 start_codon:yes stop_codon:yes gene_type:complete
MTEWIDSSDEEAENVPKMCLECKCEISTNEEHINFDNGEVILCMECADLLEHEIEIITDDEE